jgi:hypothetical protein
VAARNKRWAPTEQQIHDAGKLYGLGMALVRVAAFFGVSEQTFRHAMKKNAALRSTLEKSKAEAIGAVSRSAYEMAISKKVPAMTIFYLKCQGGWREPPRQLEVETTQAKGLLDDPNHKVTQRAQEVVQEFKGLLEELKRQPEQQDKQAAAVPVLPTDGPPALPPGQGGSQ